MKTEECDRCGGHGGEPGSNFGDHGWHPCFRCGATGRLPEGTAELEYLLARRDEMADGGRYYQYEPEYGEVCARIDALRRRMAGEAS